MAVWTQIVGAALRPALRRGSGGPRRAAFAALFALVAIWSSVAPQIPLSVGERLRLVFGAVSGLACLLAALSGVRFSASASLPFQALSSRAAYSAGIAATALRNSHEVLPAVPFLIFLLAVQAIALRELLAVFVLAAVLLLVSATLSFLTARRVCLIVCLAAGVGVLLASRRRHWLEPTLLALFACHLGLKAAIAWSAAQLSRAERPNLILESQTPAPSSQLLARRRQQLFRHFRVPFLSLLAAQAAVLVLLVFGRGLPVTFEQKSALAFALCGGVAFLFLDASALAWRGLLGGLVGSSTREAFIHTFVGVIGLPWMAAWGFSALHAGEAFSLNEGAAHYFVWATLGFAVSWAAGSSARDRLQRDLRQMLSEP